MIVAGIDPGKLGALAIVYPDGTAEFYDVPLIKVNNRTVPAWTEWEATWTNALVLAGVDMVVIEEVGVRPKEGALGAFSFGRTVGFVDGMARGLRPKVVVRFVPPSVWKPKFRLTNADKAASREVCRTLLPSTAPQLQRVKDDGRAEAALIAEYGRKYL